MLTEATTAVVLLIEAVNSTQVARSREAIEAMQALMAEHLHVTGTVFELNQATPSATIVTAS